jgi:16S rRNA (guanine966-N2)-methyltransferase
MGIRITGGIYKGRTIALAKDERTRYTSGKVREAIFNFVGEVTEQSVLDLYAGAGSFTCEALSRGAASVTSVEKNANTAAQLKNNLRSLSLYKRCLVLNMDVRYAVPMLARQRKMFDLIFVDPPYEMGYIASTADLLMKNRIYHPDSIIVFEHSKREEFQDLPEAGHKMKTRRYGDTVLTIIRCEGSETEREE